MVKNSFEGNIRLFIFYIISINYAIYMDKNLIFGPNWIQNTIVLFFSYIFQILQIALHSLFSSLYICETHVILSHKNVPITTKECGNISLGECLRSQNLAHG